MSKVEQDSYHDHFKKVGVRLAHKSDIGEFTIDAIDLNRLSLRRLREIRSRLSNCEKFVMAGVVALRNFHIDRLPSHIKAQAANSIRSAVKMAESMANGIDSVLRDYAQSSLLDIEPDSELSARTKERMANLKRIEGLYPGTWRAPKNHSKKQRP